LVQGTLDDIPCLVSCPIEFYSVAQVCLHSSPGWQTPPDAPKAAAALRAGQVFLGETGRGGHLRLRTALPRSRGYGSSTADIGAALYALAGSLEKALAPEQAAQLAIGVEPSDSTLFPGLALLDHRGGRFHERLGPAPLISILVIDPGGEVDTLAFNRLDHREALRRLAPDHREAFDLLRQGLRAGDLDAVGQAATLSACVHQAILFNPLLDQVLALAQAVGALGVCRAHSGTLLGLLLDPRHADLPALAAFVAGCLPSSVTVGQYAMVDGGPCQEVGKAETIVANPTCMGDTRG
jgi:L-threonine kinase